MTKGEINTHTLFVLMCEPDPLWESGGGRSGTGVNFKPYFLRKSKITPFDQPKPTTTSYSPPPPAPPSILTSY